ncbi:MAG: amino acid permease [Bdellovibrionaceae bacterium]|nr:amino acid permease [Pseudobdellovibrionaceae bacterium]NUM57106.1 amino acid permease [Pseudobdellovibrionaceae bacterium]
MKNLNSSKTNSEQKSLSRSLGFIDSTAIVIGTIIGTGIFLKAASMSQLLPNLHHVIGAWLVAGLLSLAGALVYSELGEIFPEAGGEFIYLKESYGEGLAFLYGWQRFWISSPGSIAAYAAGASTFLSQFITLGIVHQQLLIAVVFIIFFSVMNCFSVSFGGKLQTLLTSIKVIMIFGLIAGIYFFSPPLEFQLVHGMTESSSHFKWSAFGTAIIAALWAFDGWNNLPMAAGEIKNPSKNIPLALILGTGFVFIIYIITNLSFFHALPLAEIQNSHSTLFPEALPVATKASKSFLGESGTMFLSIAFVLSALGAMNGSILTSARVPYSMAKMNLFPKWFTTLSSAQSPYISILVQALWSCVLVASGSFDQLTDYVVFASWIFYILCSWAVIRLRKSAPNKKRSYKVPLYPYLPIFFCTIAFALLVNTLIQSPKESGIGLFIILLGIPFFYLTRKKSTA